MKIIDYWTFCAVADAERTSRHLNASRVPCSPDKAGRQIVET